MYRLWIVLLITLQACSTDPKFEFRGYTNLSNCLQVLDAELANGAEFEGVFDAEDPDDPALTAELAGELFSETVRIDVTCTGNFVDSIHYVSPASERIEAGTVFRLFAAELEPLFGPPSEVVAEDVRSLRYLCRNPSPILLEEWRFEPEEGGEEAVHEVYLAIVPDAAVCLN